LVAGKLSRFFKWRRKYSKSRFGRKFFRFKKRFKGRLKLSVSYWGKQYLDVGFKRRQRLLYRGNSLSKFLFSYIIAYSKKFSLIW
jgi:hypothetical protein